MIEKYSILDGYTEIIRLNRIATEQEVYVANGKLIEEIKSFDVSLSFAQMNGFKTEENIIIFIFIGFTTQSLKKDESITMIVNLINENNELVEENAICTSKANVEVNTGEQAQVVFECKIENIQNGKAYTGLEFVSSENITGIPSDSELLNPAKVDILIERGKMKNYTSYELDIPVFDITSINTTNSEITGKFYINGQILSEYISFFCLFFLPSSNISLLLSLSLSSFWAI